MTKEVRSFGEPVKHVTGGIRLLINSTNGKHDITIEQTYAKRATKYYGPSAIGIETLDKSGGKIPERFLRGCGAPDNFITFARSLIGQSIEFYSCFISYKDQAFAERLHTDLQSKGVHCWFAPEGFKIGDRFRDRIEESIRLHDRLLLILSEHSIERPSVWGEVESALEREQRQKRIGKSTVRIDSTVMTCDKAWAATVRRTRHIGDFSRWKSHDDYQRGSERLLRNLKAEEQ